MNRLPDEVAAFLNGKQLKEKSHCAMHFVTIDEHGFPYKAMLSVGEVLCVNEAQLRLALWHGTSTAKHVKNAKKATLMLVLPPTAYDLQLEVTFLRHEEMSVLFEATVTNVKVDRAPYATLTSGVQYELHSVEQALELWKKKLELLNR